MGLLTRVARLFRIKANALLSRFEDPTAALDDAFERLQNDIEDLEQAVKTTRTQRVRIERRRDTLEEEIAHHNEQARLAMEADREDLARRALGKKNAKLDIVEELGDQLDTLVEQEKSIEEALVEYRSKASELRTKKETKKAQFEAAESMTSVQETLSGVEEGGIGQAMQETEDRIDEMEARAQAFDELQDEGILESPLEDSDIDSELNGLETAHEVEQELETLRDEIETEAEAESV